MCEQASRSTKHLSLTHSLTHSPTYLLTHSLTHSFTHPLTNLITHPSIHPLYHLPTQSPIHPFIHSPTHSLNHSFLLLLLQLQLKSLQLSLLPQHLPLAVDKTMRRAALLFDIWGSANSSAIDAYPALRGITLQRHGIIVGYISPLFDHLIQGHP